MGTSGIGHGVSGKSLKFYIEFSKICLGILHWLVILYIQRFLVPKVCGVAWHQFDAKYFQATYS